jgi:hypothetical protein
MNTTTTLGTVTLSMIVVGLGFGLLQPSYTVAAQNAIPVQRLGIGTGALTYLRAMGSLLGTAVLGTIVAHSATGGAFTSLSLAARQALAMSLEQAFLVTFGVSAAMLGVTLLLQDVRLRKRGEGMPQVPHEPDADGQRDGELDRSSARGTLPARVGKEVRDINTKDRHTGLAFQAACGYNSGIANALRRNGIQGDGQADASDPAPKG